MHSWVGRLANIQSRDNVLYNLYCDVQAHNIIEHGDKWIRSCSEREKFIPRSIIYSLPTLMHTHVNELSAGSPGFVVNLRQFARLSISAPHHTGSSTSHVYEEL